MTDRWMGPAMSWEGGTMHITVPELGAPMLWYDVPTSPQLCPGCGEEVKNYKGQGDPKARCVGIHPDGEVAWWHIGCRIDARGDRAGAMWRKKKKTKEVAA